MCENTTVGLGLFSSVFNKQDSMNHILSLEHTPLLFLILPNSLVAQVNYLGRTASCVLIGGYLLIKGGTFGAEKRQMGSHFRVHDIVHR